MTTIVPAILESRYKAIEKKFALVADLADIIQVDICDGVFVPNTTFGGTNYRPSLKRIKHLADRHDLKLELDMMVQLHTPEQMGAWLRTLSIIQPDRVVIHMKSIVGGRHWKMFCQATTKVPCAWGLAVPHNAAADRVVSRYQSGPFSYIQVMGIAKVGYSGQSLSQKTEATIRSISQALPGVRISVDGGVKLENTQSLIDAGARQLGVNSGLFGTENIQARYRLFTQL